MKLTRSVVLSLILVAIPSLVWGQFFYKQQFFDNVGLNFNPHGASIRAIGMGNAYVAIADDASGPTWNPAGAAFAKEGQGALGFLINNSTMDLDVTYTGTEVLNDYSDQYETGKTIVSNFGYVSPIRFYDRDWALGVNYYRLYDFTKKLTVNSRDVDFDYNMRLGVEVIKITAATQVIPNIAFGFNGNIYIRGIKEKYYQRRPYYTWIVGSDTARVPYIYENDGDFNGANFDFGLQGHFGDLSIGASVSTPYKLSQKTTVKLALDVPDYGEQGVYYDSKMKIEFPFGFNVGVAYTMMEKFTIAADFSSFKFSDSRNTIHPFFAEPSSEPFDPSVSNVEYNPYWRDTDQYRIGAEYVFDIGKLTIPVRAGYRNDPKTYGDENYMYDLEGQVIPADSLTPYGSTTYGDQVDGYIVSFGTGFSYKIYSLNLAYEYGVAEQKITGTYTEGDLAGTRKIQDIKENTSKLYLSLSLIL